MSKTNARTRRRRSTRRNVDRVWIGAGIAIIVVLSAAAIIAQSRSFADIPGLLRFSQLSTTHVGGTVNYPHIPPVGGPHSATIQNCGIYDQPIANENAVHSLEHGAVWLTYRPDLPAETIEQVRSLARGRSYMLVSPYPDLPAPVVASAWGFQVQVEDASDPRLEQFIQRFRQGAQAPEPGAACSGGIGTPVAR